MDLEFFNNRELAGIIWIIVAVILCAFSKSIRGAFVRVVRAMLARPIMTAIFAFSAYTAVVLIILYQIGAWDFTDLKLTLIWFFPVMFAAMFDGIRIGDDERSTWSVIKGNLNILILVEFVANFHIFNLLVELLILPVATFLTAMQAHSEGNEYLRAANKFATWLLAILGLAFFTYSAYRIVSDFETFAKFSTLNDLLLPILLSLSLAPFIAVFAAYATYERVFVGLNITVKDDRLRRYAKRKALFVFRFDTALLRRWTGNVARSRPETRDEVDRTINEVWTQIVRERMPPEVAKEHGWSPYLSRSYLAPDGPVADHYFRVIDDLDEWSSSSPYQRFGDGVFANSIAYYLNGSEHAATELKLVLDIEVPDEINAAHTAFLSYCQRLHQAATGNDLPDPVKTALCECKEVTFENEPYDLAVCREDWPNTRADSFTLKFITRHTAVGASARY